MAAKFKYTGGSNGPGANVPGLPARDLTDEDIEAMSDEQRALLEEHMALGTQKTVVDNDEGVARELEAGEAERLRASRIYEAVGTARPGRTPPASESPAASEED